MPPSQKDDIEACSFHLETMFIHNNGISRVRLLINRRCTREVQDLVQVHMQ